jgi:hypothetical protein
MAGSIPANADVNADSLGLVVHEIPVAMPTFGVIDVGECLGDNAQIDAPSNIAGLKPVSAELVRCDSKLFVISNKKRG